MQSKLLKILGVVDFDVQVRDKVTKMKFHVVDSQCTPLIGQKSADDLRLLTFCVNNVTNTDHSVEQIPTEHQDRFQGLGKLKGFQLKLTINDKVKAVAQPNFCIPFKMRQVHFVNTKVKDLMDADVTEKVQGATP